MRVGHLQAGYSVSKRGEVGVRAADQLDACGEEREGCRVRDGFGIAVDDPLVGPLVSMRTWAPLPMASRLTTNPMSLAHGCSRTKGVEPNRGAGSSPSVNSSTRLVPERAAGEHHPGRLLEDDGDSGCVVICSWRGGDRVVVPHQRHGPARRRAGDACQHVDNVDGAARGAEVVGSLDRLELWLETQLLETGDDLAPHLLEGL